MWKGNSVLKLADQDYLHPPLGLSHSEPGYIQIRSAMLDAPAQKPLHWFTDENPAVHPVRDP